MAAGFHDVRLPEEIERGAQGGPMFSTTIMQVDSGQERRNVNWALPLARWDLSYGVRQAVEAGGNGFAAFRAFFMSRRGRAFGFRFKDWTDFRLQDDPADPLTINFPSQGSAQGISKKYAFEGDDATAFHRRITHPVLDTLRFTRTDTGAVVPSTAFEWDEDEYRLNLVAPGIPSIEVAVTGEFDVPVRFDTDQLVQSVALWNAVENPEVPIVELRPRQIRNISQTSASLGSTG